MRWIKELARRLTYLRRRNNFEQELDEEIRFHLESRVEELQKAGISQREALAQARREFGSATTMREDTRSAWQLRWLEDLFADMRYGFRALRRNPGFTLAAIFSLALGIGVNTTVFSLTMEFLFSEPSCARPETLASVRIGGNSHSGMREYRFIRDARVFEGLAGSLEEAEANWRHGDDTDRLQIMRVTDNFFELAGVPVAMGRPIQTGERDVVVLTHRFWQSRFQGDPSVLGRLMILDGRPNTVAGILPRDHRTLLGFGFSPDLYAPVSNEKDIVAFVARLSEGTSRHAALARLTTVCGELDKVYPSPGGTWTRGVELRGVSGMDRLQSDSVAPIAAFFGLLTVVVGLLLLIACANVASLLLARASSRRHELATRLAIGAGRSRIVRQLLAESLLLALLGTAAGLLLNLWLTGFMSRIYLPLPVTIQLQIDPNWRLLVYSSAVALVSALASGLMPALKATRAGVNAVLQHNDRQVGDRRWNMRNVLVAGQLGVSVLLLAAGFLFLRNLMKATSTNPGFDVERTLLARMRLVPERYASGQAGTMVATALDSLRALPGVDAASVARRVPLNEATRNGESVRTDLSDQPIHVMYNNNRVGSDYFRAMGIPIVQGREFLASDRPGSPPVVVLNENFARRLFGAVNPVGRNLRFEWGAVAVVGVAKNSKYVTLGEENVLAMYSPYQQHSRSLDNPNFLIRTSRPPGTLVKEVSAVLGALDSSAAIETRPMKNAMGFALLPSRVGAALLGSMGLLGLALASIGLYGVLAYSVSRRTREIGVRVALGAETGHIMRMIFRESFVLVAIGLVAGLGLAAVATRPLATFLSPDLSPTDPLAFFAVIGVLLLVAFAATLGPALRALRVDPMVALRYE